MDKDTQRILDIKNQPGKEIGLATKMAKLITDKDKAKRRFEASHTVFGSFHPVTVIFHKRYTDLVYGSAPSTRSVPTGTLTTIGNMATAIIDHVEEIILPPIVNIIKRTKADFPLSKRVKHEETQGTVVSHETEGESIYVLFDGESQAKDINIYKLKFA